MRVATNVSLVRGAEGRVGEGCLCTCVVPGFTKKCEDRVFQQRTHTLGNVCCLGCALMKKVRVTKQSRLSFVFSFFCIFVALFFTPFSAMRTSLECVNEPHRWVQ